MLGIFGKKGPQGKPAHRRGGRPKPKRLTTGAVKKWQPPAEEPPQPYAPAAKAGDPES